MTPMPRRVLLASANQDEMADVKSLLETPDCQVHLLPSFDAILKEARTNPPDLIVVAEELEGGSGSELCTLLDGMPRRPKLLFLGEELPRGADGCVPEGNTVMIADAASELLARLNAAAVPAPTEPSVDGDTLGWAVAPSAAAIAPRDPPSNGHSVTTPGSAAPGPSASAGPSASVTDSIEVLLKRVREADYYEILGVSPLASENEIRAAYAGRVVALKAFGAARPVVEEVRSALDEALDVLDDPVLREAYTRNRLPGDGVLK